jgi:hypothetical protein
MYRHGLGDCFLVTLPCENGDNYFILIDCGVIIGTPNAVARMQQVAGDIVATTGGKLDLLIATHEHWDHLSGFIQAADQFGDLQVDQVWLAWTEDPEDDLARQLAEEKKQALADIRLAVDHLQLLGAHDQANALTALTELHGAVGATTSDALEKVRQMGKAIRYCRPADDPVDLVDPAVRMYVLGPPRDQKLLKMTDPSRRANTYEMTIGAFRLDVSPALGSRIPDPPFGPAYVIPTAVAEAIPFFKERYWSSDAWRRIDTAWLAGASDVALQLDSMTNNTCLVVALELRGGAVLLFPGDAQVGNWLSWQDLQWQTSTGAVSGPDLLRRAIFYKVGHHGSHNATLREKGLEMMDALRVAMVPVDHSMALKKGWDRMPLPGLLDALEVKTDGAVLRADAEPPAACSVPVTTNDLYVEISLPL